MFDHGTKETNSMIMLTVYSPTLHSFGQSVFFMMAFAVVHGKALLEPRLVDKLSTPSKKCCRRFKNGREIKKNK